MKEKKRRVTFEIGNKIQRVEKEKHVTVHIYLHNKSKILHKIT